MKVIRIPEWSSREADLTTAEREEIAFSVEAWTAVNQLPKEPLYFSGPHGNTICTNNHVGVIETSSVTIEIFPKLDKRLLDPKAEFGPDLQSSSMASLMWMLEVANHLNVFDADSGGLQEAPSSFLDLWAILLSKHLLSELTLGLARTYQPAEENLSTVRGRILFQPHLLQNTNRPDRVYCGWDEFTEDRPLNQILKCACYFLQPRVDSTSAIQGLRDCLHFLEDVTPIPPADALRKAERIIWDRSSERYKLPFQLAVRLLNEIGHQTFHGQTQTYVFLLDMNQVFEDYVGAVLEQVHGVPIRKQESIGTLFRNPNKLQQKPDFIWEKNGTTYIADAKYKPFFKWSLDTDEDANNAFSVHDVRQLICYGLLTEEEDVALQIFYPFVSTSQLPPIHQLHTFPSFTLSAIPIRMQRNQKIEKLLPTSEQID